MCEAAERACQTFLQGHATASLAAIWRAAFWGAGTISLVSQLGSVFHEPHCPTG